MKAWPTAWMIGLTALGGCAIGPDYERPDDNELYISEPYWDGTKALSMEVDGNAASVARENWRSVYRDPLLIDLIEEALEGNLNLERARKRIRQASASARLARSLLWPSLEGGFDAERSRDVGSDDPVDTFNLFGLLSWELDIWGIQRRSAEAAGADLKAAQYTLAAARISLIGIIARTYFDLAALNDQLAVTRSTIEIRREGLRILNRRKENGIISGLEIRQAEVSLAEALRREPQLVFAKQQTENQLSFLIGRAPGSLDVEPRLREIEYQPDIPTGLPSELLLRRPDILASEQALVAANARIGVTKGNFFPRIRLTGELGLESAELGQLLDKGNDYFELAGNLTQPIFEAGANRARYDQALAASEEALINYRESILMAMHEVSNTLSAYHQSRIQEIATLQLLEASNEYLRLAIARYRNGIIGYIDVLDAQRLQFDAELSLSESRRDQLIALSGIYQSLGGGWDSENPSPDAPESRVP